jgi:hypothetical protein
MNRCGGARFAFETSNGFAFLEIFVVENVGTNGFYGYLSREEILVASEINLAHRAAPETFFEQVSRREQPRAGQCILRACLILRTDLNPVFVADFATWTLTHRRRILAEELGGLCDRN